MPSNPPEDEDDQVQTRIRNQLEVANGVTASSGAENKEEWVQNLAKATTAKKLNAVMEKCKKAKPDTRVNLGTSTNPDKAGRLKQIIHRSLTAN